MDSAISESEVASLSPETTSSDPFDPTRLRMSQDFSDLGVKKLLLNIPVRKPSKEMWFRVHPAPAYQLTTNVIDLKEDRETYLVDPSLWSDLAGESTFVPRKLVTCSTRQGVTFMWSLRVPGSDGKLDNWSSSALEAVERASRRWIRMGSNMSLGAYEISETPAKWSEPQWPSESFGELLRIAFKGKLIDKIDHPVLKQLRGE
jgi:hypothetical protein